MKKFQNNFVFVEKIVEKYEILLKSIFLNKKNFPSPSNMLNCLSERKGTVYLLNLDSEVLED